MADLDIHPPGTPPPPSPLPPGVGPAAPAAKPRVKVKVGEEAAKAVSKLAADLAPHAAKLGFKVGQPRDFGLGLDVHDPETGLLMAAAQPARRDVGVAGHVMTPDEVVSVISGARTHAQTAGLVRYVDEQPKPATVVPAAPKPLS